MSVDLEKLSHEVFGFVLLRRRIKQQVLEVEDRLNNLDEMISDLRKVNEDFGDEDEP